MRLYLTLLSTAFLLIGCDHQRQSDKPSALLRLPIVFKQGYGPFYPSFGILGPEHLGDQLWGKIYLPVKGIPKYWSNQTKSMIWLNAHQLVYQNFKLGNITPANYQYLQKQWKWVPDSTKLSGKPIKCYVYAVKGFDEKSNKWAVMVDVDNDLDFSDETALYPDIIKTGTIPDQVENVRKIKYEIYQKGKILNAYAPMVFKVMNSDFLYSFPQYATAIFRGSNKNHEILISPSFGRLDFEGSYITLPSSVLRSGKVDPQKTVEVGENIEIEGIRYKNKGISTFNNLLELDPVNPTTGEEYLLQVGYPFRPLTAKEFSTGNIVSLGATKGKYIFVDFWGTWCKGCVEEIPSLKKLYSDIDKNQFEFVSIACHDSPQRLKAFVAKEQIKWPQILSDNTNKIADVYGVDGFPTSVLINPQGMIVAKNLPVNVLRDKLKELSK